MKIDDLERAVENPSDQSVISHIKIHSEAKVLKKVGEKMARPVNKYNRERNENNRLEEWRDQDFGNFATYAYFLWRSQSTGKLDPEMIKIVDVLMESLACSLIAGDTNGENQRTLDVMQQNMGISQGFRRGLTSYFIRRKGVLAGLQRKYP